MIKHIKNVMFLTGFWIWSLSLWASPLETDEPILFLPEIASDAGNQQMRVDIHAWIYENRLDLGASKAFAKYLEIDEEQLSVAQRQRFKERSNLFLKDSERNREVRVRFQDQSIHTLPLHRTAEIHFDRRFR